jgi:hypothetical protein
VDRDEQAALVGTLALRDAQADVRIRGRREERDEGENADDEHG